MSDVVFRPFDVHECVNQFLLQIVQAGNDVRRIAFKALPVFRNSFLSLAFCCGCDALPVWISSI